MSLASDCFQNVFGSVRELILYRSLSKISGSRGTSTHINEVLSVRLGMDAKVVQKLLRHASFRRTMDAYTQRAGTTEAPGAAATGGPDHARARWITHDRCGLL
jgi:hypothetical protein